jgi:hypothetical protein
MVDFFRAPEGQMQAVRFGAYLYLFNTLLSLLSGGWRSIPWLLWLLMAFGFFAMSRRGAESRKSSKWRSPTYVVGCAASFLGAGLLLYRAIFIR